MDVLVFTADLFKGLDLSLQSDIPENGAVNQCMKLSLELARNGHDVTVTTPHENTRFGGLNFQNHVDLQAQKHYDLVIAVNNIAYVRYLRARGLSWDKSLFVVHSNQHDHKFEHVVLEDQGNGEFFNPNLTWVVLQSEAHRENYTRNYPAALTKATVLENAFEITEPAVLPVKTPARFVFTTRDRDAFVKLATIWPHIRSIRPEATLRVATPHGAFPYTEYEDLEGVTFLGALNRCALNAELKKAEYWIDLSEHAHEGSLLALEMMRFGVKMISTARGALKEIIPQFGYQLQSPTLAGQFSEIAALIDTSQNNDKAGNFKLVEGEKFVAQNAWTRRYGELCDLLRKEPPEWDRSHALYQRETGQDDWEQRYITSSARSKSWELITDEAFEGCFSFPLFTKDFCLDLREVAEAFRPWPVDFYNTFRLNTRSLAFDQFLTPVIYEFILPSAAQYFQEDRLKSSEYRIEAFLTKYDSDQPAKTIADHPLHHDGSLLSCVVMLSDLDEYTGGGTYFSKQKALVKTRIGDITVFPGELTHRHGARIVKSGVRYIMAIFIHKK